MEKRTVDSEITLIPYYPNSETALAWYQDPDVCKQVDNIDHVYDLELLERMYTYLSTHGDCYYIEYRGILVGDVSLRDNAEVSVVVCKEYQNRKIGRRCIRSMLSLAKEKGFEEVKANIYAFNTQSRRMFESVGFRQTGEEWYVYRLNEPIEIKEERLSAAEYIDFLKRTDLGKQYPLERFSERIEKLVKNASISLTARNAEGLLVGVLFGVTDFAYWLFLTDLGVDRAYERQGIGKRLMQTALELAGGERDITVYLVANDAAVPFYEKLGMERSDEVMQYNHIDWTDFTVE